ncbi:MAG TPA: hypothetical protein GXX48_13000 [Ochrobactrum intermedium]|uniref:Uncharacterized protein n=1 Tax=Brucella intermedia TaxID=94625 RepID=A0A7V6PCQ3_9HYPH|nr:hypothetical protein [Brucella intermedia]HHV68547.1 hypothetical protein [Brucella intermedia]
MFKKVILATGILATLAYSSHAQDAKFVFRYKAETTGLLASAHPPSKPDEPFDIIKHLSISNVRAAWKDVNGNGFFDAADALGVNYTIKNTHSSQSISYSIKKNLGSYQISTEQITLAPGESFNDEGMTGITTDLVNNFDPGTHVLNGGILISSDFGSRTANSENQILLEVSACSKMI